MQVIPVARTCIMSDQDEALLDEDLGDEEYDLGNDEEEALLADDYEIDRQNSYKGEEETDDVLDLGVTDALDDLEGEDEIVEYRSDGDSHNYSEFYKEERRDNRGSYYNNEEAHEDRPSERRNYDEVIGPSVEQHTLSTGDLREKLQKNVQRKMFVVGNGQGLEDDDCDEAEERRNRFQNERIMISPKMNNEIPDSLENVVTVEQARHPPMFRIRGRGRGMRGLRGARFPLPGPHQPNFPPRFNANMRGQPVFAEQQSFRGGGLIEERPPIFSRMPSNNAMNHHHPQQQQQQHHHHHYHQHQNQQQHPRGPAPQQPQHQLPGLMYQQNPVQHPAYMQNGPPGGPHFPEPRPPFNPNQFPSSGIPGPRMVGAPRPEFNIRGPVPGMIPRYNCPPGGPNFGQNPAGPYQPAINQGPSLLANPGINIPNNQPPGGIRGNPGVPLINQGPIRDPIMSQNFPRMQGPPNPPGINPPIPAEAGFDGRFQEPQNIVENRPVYEGRPPFNASVNPPQQQVGPHVVPNVPMPPGHKILINPHFRGTVQPTPDARLAWDIQQQQPQPSQPPQHQPPPHQPPQQPPHQPPALNAIFAPPRTPYQNQEPYGGPPALPQHPTSHDYQHSYQPAKSDDPYAYFSDVWQENKAQKNPPMSKSYSSESNYSRENYSDYGSKYGKSENTWEHRDSYQDEQRGSSQNYRDRDPPPRSRTDTVPRQRVSSSSGNYPSKSVEQRPRAPDTVSARPVSRPPIKRSPESHDRVSRQLSPKRVKTVNNRHEARSVQNENSSSKKEEDMDPEEKEYRKKLEEQKRLREKILQEKENRRKQAALEKLGDESKGNSRTIENVQSQETKPAPDVTKDNPVASRGRGRLVNAQATESSERPTGIRIVRALQVVEGGKVSQEKVETVEKTRQVVVPSSGTRRVVIQKSAPTKKVATSVQKAVSNLQRTSTTARVQKAEVPGLKKASAGLKVVGSGNRIVQDASGPLRPVQTPAKPNIPKVVVSALNNQRLVLQKSGQAKRASDLRTNTVKIENLAASTSESQIRRMCQGIGTLESIHMGEGNATIVFKTQSAALVFHKKYQRKMLDLSLINVRLVQQQASNN